MPLGYTVVIYPVVPGLGQIPTPVGTYNNLANLAQAESCVQTALAGFASRRNRAIQLNKRRKHKLPVTFPVRGMIYGLQDEVLSVWDETGKLPMFEVIQ